MTGNTSLAAQAVANGRWRLPRPKSTKLTGDAVLLSAIQAERSPAWLRWPAFLAVLLNRIRARATD